MCGYTARLTQFSTRFNGVSLRSTNLFNVLCRVVISIMDRATTGTNPTANREWHFRSNHATTRALTDALVGGKNIYGSPTSAPLASPTLAIFQSEINAVERNMRSVQQ